MTVRKLSLLVLVLALMALPALAQADSFGFASPVFVDKTLGGGEPLVAYAVKSGLLVYTSHEGTTHLFTSGLVGAPAESGGFISGYHNQVNIWTSADNGKTWKLVPFGSSTNPFATGFSDPDLTQDAGGNIYNTGIDLANDALFSSQDGGKTWPTGTLNCHEGDRPWLAGGANNEVWLSTDLQESGHAVFHSTDAGASCSSNSIPDFGSTPDGGSYTGDGKLYYDRTRNQLVEPVYYSKNGLVDGVGIGILPSPSGAFSDPSAKFSDVQIAKTTAWSHWPSLAIDSAGNYYMVWDTDDRDTTTANGCPSTYSGSESFGAAPPVNAPTPLANRVMMSYSTDGGHTWSTPYTVAYVPGHRLLWPWAVAGTAGRVGVTWYEFNSVVDPDCAPSTAKVSVMATELSGADTATPSALPAIDAVGRPIHSGSVCAGGTTCAADNVITGEDRRLGDFFTDSIDNRGCLMIATGDTTIVDAITGGQSPISHPLFLHQDSGTSLTGQPCGTAASTTGTGSTQGSTRGKHRHRARHRKAHHKVRTRPPKHQQGFTGRARST